MASKETALKHATTSLLVSDLRENPRVQDPGHPARKKRLEWKEEESILLRLGVLKHGVGSWQKILDDDEFKDGLKLRDNGDLKDRWRTMNPVAPGQKTSHKAKKWIPIKQAGPLMNFMVDAPSYNKGLSFTLEERDANLLRGLLPPAVISQELQLKSQLKGIRSYEIPSQRFLAIMDTKERDERLFYKLLIDNVEELLPFFNTTTVGDACRKYGTTLRRPQGLYITSQDIGNIEKVLDNWHLNDVHVIVVTNGESISGVGDLGCQSMGIPVSKLALYTALGGIRPSVCLPVCIDVGTNNPELLNDETYIGIKQERLTGEGYTKLLKEFMDSVTKCYGREVLVHFENFSDVNTMELLSSYSGSHCVLTDINVTAAVILSGVITAVKKLDLSLHDQVFLIFNDSLEVGSVIAAFICELIERQISRSLEVEELDKVFQFVDNETDILDAVKDFKPTVLIGSRVTEEVVEAMASFNRNPIILSDSNQSCTAEEADIWSKHRAVFAVANSEYIFPGIGLGLVISGASHLHRDIVVAAAESLAGQVSREDLDRGLLYPPITDIRRISAVLAACVAEKARELGNAAKLPSDLEGFARRAMFNPSY